MQRLEERLELFQQDHRLRRISARLEPGEQRGETLLRLAVEEAFPATLALEWSNDVPPSLGEQSGRADATLANLIGVGDELSGGVHFSDGLVDPEVRYGVPINRWDTELEARVRYSDGEIVEKPFDQADFTSTAFTAGHRRAAAALAHAEPTRCAWRCSASGDARRPRWTARASASPARGADPDDGVSKLSVLRLGGDWVHRTR